MPSLRWAVSAVWILRAYLRTSLVNASRSRFRRLAVERRHRADPMPLTLQPEFDHLLVAIRKIPERQRTALILRYYADLSVEQVATTMGCPFATAKSLIQRGLVQRERSSPPMTVEHADLEERLAKALKAAAASIPHDEPPVEWVDVVRRCPPAPVRRDRPHSRGRVWIISAVAGVIVLGAVVTVAIALAPTSHNRTTFASRLLTAAPQKGSAPRSSAGDWTLLGYVSDATWRVNPQGPSSGSIASELHHLLCGVRNQHSDIGRRTDRGHRAQRVEEQWGEAGRAYRMPSGLGLTSPLSCPTHDDLDCLAGGTHGAGPALLSTSDGGRRGRRVGCRQRTGVRSNCPVSR